MADESKRSISPEDLTTAKSSSIVEPAATTRQRKTGQNGQQPNTNELLAKANLKPPNPKDMPRTNVWSSWLALAILSGACAAFNGAFAKLTTAQITTRLAQKAATLLDLTSYPMSIEYVFRALAIAMNLMFNGVMWGLFTAALTRSSSTTKVSIVNTSSNFLITALLGFAVFSENLTAQWWLGASLLVAGNVIIGSQREPKMDGQASERDEERPSMTEQR